MSGGGERTRVLGNAAAVLAVVSPPLSLALVFGMLGRGASRTPISLAFMVSVAAIGLFAMWLGVARRRPLRGVVGALALAPVIAFALLTMRHRAFWWGPWILGDCDSDTAYAVAMVAVTPAAVSVFLGALAVREGRRGSQAWTVTKGVFAVTLGLVLGCVEGFFALAVATWM